MDLDVDVEQIVVEVDALLLEKQVEEDDKKKVGDLEMPERRFNWSGGIKKAIEGAGKDKSIFCCLTSGHLLIKKGANYNIYDLTKEGIVFINEGNKGKTSTLIMTVEELETLLSEL